MDELLKACVVQLTGIFQSSESYKKKQFTNLKSFNLKSSIA